MTDTSGEPYRGLPGAIPYAFRASRSWLFRAYVVVGTLLAALIGLLFVLALVTVIAETVGTSASLSLSRSFFVVVALLLVLPIVGPILLVASRHRRAVGDDASYDRRLAASGFAFVVVLYVSIVIVTPEEYRQPVDGSTAGVVDALYALPWTVGLLLPIATVVLMYAVHRISR